MIKNVSILVCTLMMILVQTQTLEEKFEGFEQAEDFAVDNLNGWIFHDLDKGQTYTAAANTHWQNEAYVGVAIVFNSSKTNPPFERWKSRTGEKGLYFFASGANGTTKPNNDWAIMPKVSLGNQSSFSMWAKSIEPSYGLEKFDIAVSTTGTNPEDFIVVSGNETASVPGKWTEYTIDLSAYNNKSIYIAIHYISDDTYALQTDDYMIKSSNLGTIDMMNGGKKVSQIFPNPVKNELNFILTDNFSKNNVTISIFNMDGKKIASHKFNSKGINVSSLPSGFYVAEITDGNITEQSKFIKK